MLEKIDLRTVAEVKAHAIYTPMELALDLRLTRVDFEFDNKTTIENINRSEVYLQLSLVTFLKMSKYIIVHVNYQPNFVQR